VVEGQGAVRDKIARYLGYGRTAIERAGTVVGAAEDEPEPYAYECSRSVGETAEDIGIMITRRGNARRFVLESAATGEARMVEEVFGTV